MEENKELVQEPEVDAAEAVAAEPEPEKPAAKKVPIAGWVALVMLIVLLSGIFQKAEGPLRAFDFSNLSGAFGTIQVPVVDEDGSIVMGEDGTAEVTKCTYQGKGGTGAREGIMVAISLLPLTAFAFGLIELCQNLGAMDAAEKLFKHVLRPLYGIPGVCGIAYVASFTSSDIGALMTREMHDNGELTDEERIIFVSYQYPATAVIGNTISTQAALLPCIVVSSGVAILVLWVCKTIGANLVRLAIKFGVK